ncbi:antibiotic biosynthesis monooxygenase [Rhodococcus sp. SRB_17]|uniref:putative quinol monooxygenase n=1 Tax=Rhodococcus sp. OK302 TaxID=1882769 RepID=UPI000B9400FE|nr:putative quinol monooxygenase [Rhodococcus sp. OK302]NMM90084.1 antibiotic biosynthesis monooxygenase [Rhodococcus sp. SRB_17]OYD70665.1 quinol monooxygenase YgiN [Rhodococcus sp. OK302]
MIFIVVKFNVLEEYQDDWLSITKKFTESTRAEAGNLWFDWFRSADNPAEYVLVEAFRDSQAGAEHVSADHFKRGMESMRPALSETPRIINAEIPGIDWSRMGELEIT